MLPFISALAAIVTAVGAIAARIQGASPWAGGLIALGAYTLGILTGITEP